MKRYSETIQIQSNQSNRFAEATIPSILNFMLEAAWAHAQEMDWGYELLKKHNMFWVLSRFFADIKKLPRWRDKITLETWSAGTDGIYAYREFILTNEQNEVLVVANSAWLILDIDTRKIAALRNHRDTFPQANEPHVCRKPKRLRSGQPEAKSGFKPVVFSDVDINNHFNSVKALERVLDDYGIEFQNEFEPSIIEINYLKEGLPGDNLAVHQKAIDGSKFQSAIIRESDGAELSIFEIEWRQKTISSKATL